MRTAFRLYRRGRVFYCQNKETGAQSSLGTDNKNEAQRLLHAKNEAARQNSFNVQIARIYWQAGDPRAAGRTWQHVMDETAKTKTGGTKARWIRAMAEAPFDIIRNRKLLETGPEAFIKMMATGSPSTNLFLRRLRNFALDLNWIPASILPRKRWPQVKFLEKRAIRAEEHGKIVAGERNNEWRAYWRLFASVPCG